MKIGYNAQKYETKILLPKKPLNRTLKGRLPASIVIWSQSNCKKRPNEVMKIAIKIWI